MKLKEILSTLIAFPCLGGESNLTIIHWIKDYLEKQDIEAKLVFNSDKTKASLHCRIGPPVNGGVILSGHTDVVPVEGQDWKTDPFTLMESENRYYGRGTCDMKGFLASCMASISEFKKLQLQRPIYFAFSYDEEIGCLGAPDLIRDIQSHYTEKPALAIIGEPTMMELVAGQKGICVMETKVNGTAGHSSRIKQEVSAVHEAARLVTWLENKMHACAENTDADMHFDPPHSSIHVGTIHGGIASNVIADECRFTWDIRTIPSDTPEEIIDAFNTHCRSREEQLKNRFPEFTVKNTALVEPVPGLNAFNDKKLIAFMQKLTGKSEVHGVSYAAEAGQFAEAGIPAIICGPGDIAQAHRANEFAAIDQLKQCCNMMRDLAQLCAEKT